MKVHRTVKNTAISVLVLLVLLVGAGVAYTLFAYQKPSVTASTAPTEQKVAPIKPVKPAANAQEGVALGSLTTPIKPGDNASMTVQTNAGSKCSISVVYNNVASSDSGLAPKLADDFGSVSWTWTVGNSVPPGKWPVKVTCVYNGRSGVLQADLEVTK